MAGARKKRTRRKEAYIAFFAGIYRVCTYPDQELITKTRVANKRSFRAAVRRANALGYSVRVYVKYGSKVYHP